MSLLAKILSMLRVEQPAPELVDIAVTLDSLASQHHDELDWRHSVVDLMKVLDMDSSLEARQELARELHFPGDVQNLAAMNMWLHRELMRRVSDNGGKVPPELL